jgi:3-methylcrotonyl-CoA carboxylase alpha subunit
MFRKLLIANRGEIACRVIRTARRMGIATVAVYSDADAGALHVALADMALRIGPAAPRDSYLNIPAILEAIQKSGAEAVHPGYGFLSENPAFAEACAQAGIVFIGPPAAAMRAMGDKSTARALMERAGVKLVPGYHGAAQDEATLAEAAARIKFPVLIKASAGGGGKGMRVVEKATDLQSAILAARREALSSFGDDRVLIERYLTRPRHIEMQIFADTHDNFVSLFERDCSVQRRYQKIIEEAPAPGLPDTMRQAMGDAAIAAAKAVGYVGAGTVEFIVADDAFHFMEMNTRLQVEHPVTEAITAQDLVEWQIRVANGERLPLLQHDLSITGHAIEVRLYAEDPARGFMPSVGTLSHLHLPADARVETGLRAGDHITPDYDPMLAKLIVHGPDRDTALRRLSRTLAACEVVGVQTNLTLLQAIAAHPDFRAGDIDTGFIDRHPDVLAHPVTGPYLIAAAALAVVAVRARAALTDGDPHSPWAATDSWRMNLPGMQTVLLGVGQDRLTIRLRPSAGPGWHLEWDGVAHIGMAQDGMITLDGVACHVTVVPGQDSVTVIADGANHVFHLIDPLLPPHAEAAGGGHIMAPIPGRIAAVLVQPGEAVTRGQPMLVLEAMKMEMTITAPQDGVIGAIRCATGDMVSEGFELVTFREDASA